MKILAIVALLLLPIQLDAQPVPPSFEADYMLAEDVPIPSGHLTLIKETQDTKDAELQFQARWQAMMKRHYNGSGG